MPDPAFYVLNTTVSNTNVKKEYFGITTVEEVTGLKSTRASELIKLLVDSEVIVPVTGHEKGKYRF